MALSELLQEQKSCPRCNICKWIPIEKYKRAETQAICPALETYQFHAYSAGGKQHMSIAVTEGRIPFDESVADVAYKCNLCGGCEFSCKVYRPDMDVTETFDELRIACAEKGLVHPEHRKMMESLAATGDCYGRKPEDRIDWTKETEVKTISAGQTGEVFLFAGSEAFYDEKQAKRTAAAAKLLQSKGFDLVTAGTEEANSGYEAFTLGFIDAAKESAGKVRDQVERSGAKTIIVMDAHSFGMMRNYYPRHGVMLGAEVKHITEILAELLADGKITFTGKLDKTVTYHDPCYLGRRSDPFKPPFPGPKDMRPVAASRTGQLGVYEAPRALIQAVPGVTLTEMDRIRGYAWCCGGGSGVAEAYPEMTEKASKARIAEAELTGAEILVTACSCCEHVLKGAAQNMQIMDVLDLFLTEGGAN